MDIKNILKKDYEIIKKQITKSNLIIFLIIGLIFFIMLIFDLSCPIQRLTGISCPGCGMTRAYIHLAKLDLKGAFFCHPLWWIVPFIPMLWFAYQRKNISRSVYLRGLTFVALCFILIYFYRMIRLRGEILQFHPENGALCRLIHLLF